MANTLSPLARSFAVRNPDQDENQLPVMRRPTISDEHSKGASGTKFEVGTVFAIRSAQIVPSKASTNESLTRLSATRQRRCHDGIGTCFQIANEMRYNWYLGSYRVVRLAGLGQPCWAYIANNCPQFFTADWFTCVHSWENLHDNSTPN